MKTMATNTTTRRTRLDETDLETYQISTKDEENILVQPMDVNPARIYITAQKRPAGADQLARASFRASSIYSIDVYLISKTCVQIRFSYYTGQFEGDRKFCAVEIHDVDRMGLGEGALMIHVKGTTIKGLFSLY